MNKAKILVLVAVFATGFLVRFYKFNEPVADWHSFRQSDTHAVSQIFSKEGINFLYPKYYDISNVQSGLDNTKGYRFVEFPLFNALNAFLYNNIGLLNIIQWGRLINIVSSCVTALVVFLLVRKYSGYLSALFASGFFLFIPFSIFYSRVILPDVMMTTMITSGIYFFDKFLEKRKSKFKSTCLFAIASLLVSLSFLLKPFAIFFTIPIIFLVFQNYKWKAFLKWYLYLFAIVSLVPLVLWRSWIGNFPEGVPASDWLFNGNAIRFRPSFFRWIFFERITKLILGYFGVLFLFLSLLNYKSKTFLFYLSFAASSLLYILVIATGNVQHDYYQILIIPTVSIFCALGAVSLLNFITKKTNKIFGAFIISILFCLSFIFAWGQVKDYFNINDRGMVEAGRVADIVLPRNAIVIAPYDGSTTLLNMTQRRGWPVFQDSIEELIGRGAEYLVIANPTPNDLSGFGQKFEIISKSESYLILKLK